MIRRLLVPALATLLATLAACGGGGGGGGGPPPPMPTVTLTASATDVKVGDAVTLTWGSTNASGCTASGGWTGSLASAGSQQVTVATAGAANYLLSCSGGGGTGSASTMVTAWLAPVPTLTADATSILANNTVKLTWSSKNATACTGADALTGASGLTGTQTSAVLTASTVFTIDCTNPAYKVAVGSSVPITVSTTFTLQVLVQYQVPGAPILDSTTRYYVPDWAHPVTKPVPFVWVEAQDPGGNVIGSAYADATGTVNIPGLNPAVAYTPVVRSKALDTMTQLDIIVLNNTAPLSTSAQTFRTRYAPFAVAGQPFTASGRLAVQNAGMLTATIGWDATSKTLVNANRFAAPLALLANAIDEEQIATAAIGGSPQWKPLTILWSPTNTGSTGSTDNYDTGVVSGSGGFYNSNHKGIDPSGAATLALPYPAENYVFLSGDPNWEAMDLYPFVLAHEMGHFVQSQFSTRWSPGGNHSYDDYQDPTLAWIEGSASGIASLVLNTAEQNRIGVVNNQIVVGVYDIAARTISGNAQTWPVGWFQETTVTKLMWESYNPTGTVKLPASAVLAPMLSAAWRNGPWLNTAWAFTVQLAKLNAAQAAAIDTLGDSLNVKTTGDDEWGATETNTGNRTATDSLPPYTTVTIGAAPVTVCSHGAPLDYNKEANSRYIRVMGDNANHTVTVTGPTGTVPTLVGTYYSAGSNTLSQAFSFPAGYSAFSVGDCAVTYGQYQTDIGVCKEPATPPVEQCWSVKIQ